MTIVTYVPAKPGDTPGSLIPGEGDEPPDWDATLAELGYVYCRPCREHHRGDECAINEHGQPLGPDGEPW
jgi:hypothetical protein